MFSIDPLVKIFQKKKKKKKNYLAKHLVSRWISKPISSTPLVLQTILMILTKLLLIKFH